VDAYGLIRDAIEQRKPLAEILYHLLTSKDFNLQIPLNFFGINLSVTADPEKILAFIKANKHIIDLLNTKEAIEWLKANLEDGLRYLKLLASL
ncbi:hypothetical protein DRO24_03505, partial [Candidatus Bathyarchaeota archaeon]